MGTAQTYFRGELLRGPIEGTAKRVMNSATKETRPLTSVELVDAAVWREIGSEEPQLPETFVVAIAALLGRWLLVRSDTPQMDLMAITCRAWGFIQRGGAEQSKGKE